MTVECLKFKSYTKGALQGFADLYVPKMGLELYGCSLFMKNGHKWIALPSKEYQDDQGETKWAPVVRFREKSHMDAFSAQAIRAIDDWCAANTELQQQKNESQKQEELQPF